MRIYYFGELVADTDLKQIQKDQQKLALFPDESSDRISNVLRRQEERRNARDEDESVVHVAQNGFVIRDFSHA